MQWSRLAAEGRGAPKHLPLIVPRGRPSSLESWRDITATRTQLRDAVNADSLANTLFLPCVGIQESDALRPSTMWLV